MVKLVGILNVTPDSFSDGDAHSSVEEAVQHTKQMIEDGASVIDVGAESTRPGATAVLPEKEWLRLEPILKYLVDDRHGAQISVDTRHAKTAKKALELGVDWINDVSGFSNPKMIDAVRDSDCMIVAMHSLTIPADKNVVLPSDCDPVEVVRTWFEEKLNQLTAAEISADRIIFDPGIGFGKTAEQSMALIQRADELRIPETELMFGHSRKSFLKLITDAAASAKGGSASGGDRDEATAEISKLLISKGVDYLRVHNVAINRI